MILLAAWLPIQTRNLFKINSVNPGTIPCPLGIGLILNVHKTFKRRSGRLLNGPCTFNSTPVSPGGCNSANKPALLTLSKSQSILSTKTLK